MSWEGNRMNSLSTLPIATITIDDDDIQVLPIEMVNVSIDSSDDEENDGTGSVISIATTVEEQNSYREQNLQSNIKTTDGIEKLLDALRIKAEDEDVKSYVLPYLKSMMPAKVNNANNIEIIKEEEIVEESSANDDGGGYTSMPDDSVGAVLNTCSDCSFVASERSSYLQHLKDVHKVKLFECLHCSVKYLHEEFLFSHMKQAHLQHLEPECSICHKHVESRTQLIIHLIKAHSFTDAALTGNINLELIQPNVKQKSLKNNKPTAEDNQKRDSNPDENVYDNNRIASKRLNSSEKLIVDIVSNGKRHEHVDKCKNLKKSIIDKKYENKNAGSKRVNDQMKDFRHAKEIDNIGGAKLFENINCSLEKTLTQNLSKNSLVLNNSKRKTISPCDLTIEEPHKYFKRQQCYNVPHTSNFSDGLLISADSQIRYITNSWIKLRENQTKDMAVSDAFAKSGKLTMDLNNLGRTTNNKIKVENKSEDGVCHGRVEIAVSRENSVVNDNKNTLETSRNVREKLRNNENQKEQKIGFEKNIENKDDSHLPETSSDKNESRDNAKDVLDRVLITQSDDSEDFIKKKKLLANMLSYLRLLKKVPVPKEQDFCHKNRPKIRRSALCKIKNRKNTSLRGTDVEQNQSTESRPESPKLNQPRAVSTKKVSKSRHRLAYYQCFICNLSVTKESDLITHTRTKHVDYESLQCLICKRLFGFFRTLKRHFCFNHGITKIQVDRDFKFIEKKVTSNKKSRTNAFTPARIKANANTVSNKKKSVASRNDVKKPETSVTSSDDRQKTDSISNTTDISVKNAEKCFVCSCCSFSTQRRKKLKKHMKDVHKTELLHKCSYCEKLFATTNELTRHLQRFHRYSESLLCLSCNRKFKYMKILKEHVRDRHGNTTKLQPEVDFKIVEHISNCRGTNGNTRRGISRYKCRKCNFNSTVKSFMRMHIKLHTQNVPRKRSVRKIKQDTRINKCSTPSASVERMSSDHTYYSPPKKQVDLLKISRKMQRRPSTFTTGLHEFEKRTIFVAKPFGNCKDATVNLQYSSTENKFMDGSETVISSEIVDMPLGQDSETVVECPENNICGFNLDNSGLIGDGAMLHDGVSTPDVTLQQSVTFGVDLSKIENSDVINITMTTDTGQHDVGLDTMAVVDNVEVEGSNLSGCITTSNIIEQAEQNTAILKRQVKRQIRSTKLDKTKANKRKLSDDNLEANAKKSEQLNCSSMALYPNTEESIKKEMVNTKILNTENFGNPILEYFNSSFNAMNDLNIFTNERSKSNDALLQIPCDNHNHIEAVIEDTLEHSDTDLEVADIFSKKPFFRKAKVKTISKKSPEEQVIVLSESPAYIGDLNKNNIELFEEESSNDKETTCSGSNKNISSEKTCEIGDLPTNVDNISDGTDKNIPLKVEGIKSSIDIENETSDNLGDNPKELTEYTDSEDDIIFVNTYVETERNINNIEIVEEDLSDIDAQTEESFSNIDSVAKEDTVKHTDDNKEDILTMFNTVDVSLVNGEAKNREEFEARNIQPTDDVTTKSRSHALYKCFQCLSKYTMKVDLLTHIKNVHSLRRKVTKNASQPIKTIVDTPTTNSYENTSNDRKVPKSRLIRVLSDISLKIVKPENFQLMKKANENIYMGAQNIIEQETDVNLLNRLLDLQSKDLRLSKDSHCHFCQEKFLTSFDCWEHMMNVHEKETLEEKLETKSQNAKEFNSVCSKSRAEVVKSSKLVGEVLEEKLKTKNQNIKGRSEILKSIVGVAGSLKTLGTSVKNEALKDKLKSKNQSANDTCLSLRSKNGFVIAESLKTFSARRQISCRQNYMGSERNQNTSSGLNHNRFSNNSRGLLVSSRFRPHTSGFETKGSVNNQYKAKDNKEECLKKSSVLEERNSASNFHKIAMKKPTKECSIVLVKNNVANMSNNKRTTSELQEKSSGSEERDPATLSNKKSLKEECPEESSALPSVEPPPGPLLRAGRRPWCRLFKCGLCRHRTTLKTQLVRHLRAVHERRPGAPRCPLCDYEGAPSELLEHVSAAHHAACSAPGCPVCGYSRRWAASLGGLGVACALCPALCASRASLAAHGTLAHPGTPQPGEHACLPCGIELGDEERFVRHLCEKHEAQHVYNCVQCSFTSTFNLYLQDHVRIVHDRLSCPACDLRPPLTAGKKDTCICRTLFKSCGPSWPSLAEPVEAEDSPNETPAHRLCRQCGWMFASTALLEVHKQQHETTSKPTGYHTPTSND